VVKRQPSAAKEADRRSAQPPFPSLRPLAGMSIIGS
jgi:hypothetical protein